MAIARAIAGDAPLVVCDEPVSALDVSVQAAVLRLLVELQAQRATSYLFVSHDLAVVGYLADRIVVMYTGTIVEEGPTEAVLRPPFHPYTAKLLTAAARTSGEARCSANLGRSLPEPGDQPVSGARSLPLPPPDPRHVRRTPPAGAGNCPMVCRCVATSTCGPTGPTSWTT